MPVAVEDRVLLDRTFRGTYWDQTTGYLYFPNMGSLGGGGVPTTYDVFTAAGQTKNSPAAPTVGDEWWTINDDATFTGCTLSGTAGATLDGHASLSSLDGPFAILWRYMSAGKWFAISVKTSLLG